MADGKARRFDRAFKLAALARMAAGENVSALSRELEVRRKLLYQWRDTVRRGGAEALRGNSGTPGIRGHHTQSTSCAGIRSRIRGHPT